MPLKFYFKSSVMLPMAMAIASVMMLVLAHSSGAAADHNSVLAPLHSAHPMPSTSCAPGSWQTTGRVLVTEPPCNVSANTLAAVDQLAQLQACARFASSCR